ncbi:MAG: F0F1 ATP synthase subunit delta [Wenzhouxiangellaceae bacterium]
MLAKATLARPYARAAFAVADHAGRLERWSAWLDAAATAVRTDALKALLGHPRLDQQKLMALFSAVLGDEVDPEFRNFLEVLIHYRRLELLPEISAQFEELRRERERRLKVEVTSAVALDAEQREQLIERLKQRYDSDIELHASVDPKLLGGMVIRIGDKVIDASVRGRLDQLHRSLAH